MLWEVSTAEVGQDQETNKDTGSRMFNTLFGRRKSTTEETDTEMNEESAGNMEQFNLCPDPTCKEHIDTFGEIIFWKIKNASDKNYSYPEINEVTNRKRRQAIRDYRTVAETAEELVESATQDTNEDQSVKGRQAQREKETPPQQLDRCECGERQKPTQTSVGTTTTEEESVKDSNQAGKSFKMAVSALPFVKVDVGGGTEEKTETITKKKESLKTVDTATFRSAQISPVKNIL